jgi:hypothetical protein
VTSRAIGPRPRRRGGGSRGGSVSGSQGGGGGRAVAPEEAEAVEKPGHLFLYLDFYMCHEHIVLPFFC